MSELADGGVCKHSNFTHARSKKIEQADLTAQIQSKFNQNLPFRKRQTAGGTVYLDRQAPFLCIYRKPIDRHDKGTDKLIISEAAHIIINDLESDLSLAQKITHEVIKLNLKEFGAFLVIEIWTLRHRSKIDNLNLPVKAPRFTIHSSRASKFRSIAATLIENLSEIKLYNQKSEVELKLKPKNRIAPPKLHPIIDWEKIPSECCPVIGIEIDPVYQGDNGELVFPVALRRFRRGFSKALKRTLQSFVKNHTNQPVASYLSLGRKSFVKEVYSIDAKLNNIASSFDFLLKVTPVNAEQAWNSFKKSKFQKAPAFRYRPLEIEPSLVKRDLFRIPIEKIEDPTLEQIFFEKQIELDRQLSMLNDLRTKRFLYGSLQLFGELDPRVIETAGSIIEKTPAFSRKRKTNNIISAEDFSNFAQEEIRYYSALSPIFSATVQVRDDIYTGLMVSQGNLYIGKKTQISTERIEALLSHEIGTHSLTYFNGKLQPFKLLSSGLADYDELQEGLAVLSEFLTGGLLPSRLRLLAARVLGAKAMLDGGDFIEVYRLLNKTYKFKQKTSFTIAMRLFRGGGLTKDAVYLRGFLKLIEYLSRNRKIDQLYIGKIGFRHIPLVKELIHRHILIEPQIKPRYLNNTAAIVKLDNLSKNYNINALVQEISVKRKT